MPGGALPPGEDPLRFFYGLWFGFRIMLPAWVLFAFVAWMCIR